MASIVINFENNEMLNTLYHKAVRLRLVERGTKEFWMYVFNTLVFPERNYLASPPVAHNTPSRVAIVVKKLQESSLRVVLWREDNLATATPDDIVEVETQGFTAGFDHLDRGEMDRDAVWVMTGYGTHSKL